MNKLSQGLLLMGLMVSLPLIACTKDGLEGFLPKNDLYIPVNQMAAAGITEAQFNSVIDQAETIYAPVVAEYGGQLEVARNWSDGTVNAYAEQMGNIWKVSMFGGLARHKTITADGFALVVCHELGHHIGGAPKYVMNEWASNEGQSDYFATLKCLRRIWASENNAAAIKKLKISKYLRSKCSKQWANKEDRNLCMRGAMAGKSVANLFQVLRNSKVKAKFSTPDAKIVTSTLDSHPATQCRLDTYFQGALCEKSFNEEIGQTEEVAGTCHASTGQSIGLRPKCWFSASVK